jgi:phage-related protein
VDILLSDEVKAYIKALSSNTEKAQIAQYFDRQEELGHRLKEPVSKSLGEGINEIRPGPHRFLFFYHKGSIFVVHAFRKKTQHTPDHEIKVAIRKKRELEAR